MNHVRNYTSQCERADFNGPGAHALRQDAAQVLEQVFSSLVETSSLPSETLPDIDFAMAVFQVDDSTPIEMVVEAYRSITRDLLEFGKWLRHEAIGLLPTQHRPKDRRFCADIYSRRYNKVVAQVRAMYMCIRGAIEMVRMREPNYEPPLSEMTTVNPPMEPSADDKDEVYSDQHRVILSYLYKLAAMRARKHEGMVMVPVVTETGYNSTAYKVLCSIDEFVGKDVYHSTEPELWRLVTGSRGIAEWTRRVLREYDHIEFPPLVRSRNMAFNDGVYIVSEDRFRPYTSADRRTRTARNATSPEERRHREQLYQQTEQLHRLMMTDFTTSTASGGVNSTATASPSSSSRTPLYEEQYRVQVDNMFSGEPGFYGPAACVYHKCDFDWQRHAKYAMDIKTPNCDRIWQAQDLDKPDKDKGTGPEVIEQIYALIGRMLHEVGSLDDWQLSPFFKGVAGTGKSTILRLIRAMFSPEDVGVIPNNIEPVFGLSAVYEKLIIICFELRSDFGLNPALMQTMMSGEPMQIQVKFKTAIPNFEWKAPFAAAGNMNADWPDAQGAISRRWALIGFTKALAKGDASLMSKLKAEMPLIIQKANRAYFEMLRKAGSHQAWDRDGTGKPYVLCNYFHIQRDKLTEQIDSIMACVVKGGRLVRPGDLEGKADDEYYMTWHDFMAEYGAFCKLNGLKQMNTSSEDAYNTTLQKLRLRRVLTTKPDYKLAGKGQHTWWLIGIRATKTFEEDDDDD